MLAERVNIRRKKYCNWPRRYYFPQEDVMGHTLVVAMPKFNEFLYKLLLHASCSTDLVPIDNSFSLKLEKEFVNCEEFEKSYYLERIKRVERTLNEVHARRRLREEMKP